MTRLSKGIFSTVLFFLFTETASASNPFSAYSPQWDLSYFSAAALNNGSTRMTTLEKEFMHAFNLARMSPVLFVSTVFEPWCEKHKPKPYPYDLISDLYNTSSLKLVAADDFLQGIAATMLERAIVRTGHPEVPDSFFLKAIRPLNRYLYVSAEQEGAVQLLFRLLTEGTGSGSNFRKLFFENNPLAGFHIGKDGQGKNSLLLFTCTSEEHQAMLDLRKTVILSPDIHVATDYRFDEELGEFMQVLHERGRSGLGFTLPLNARYMAPKQLLLLKDSLEKRNIACSLRLLTCRRNSAGFGGSFGENGDPLFEVESDEQNAAGRMESDSAFDRYYAQRIVNPKDGSSTIQLYIISVKNPLPFLPHDSIGHFSPTTDFSAIDLQARKVDAATPELLVKKLIAPQMSELYRVRAIFIWMVSHLNYDNAGLAAGTPAVEVPEIWKKRVAICSGYAALFDHLCRLAGIRSHKVSGMADGVELGAHAWNVVLIGGRYHLLDATWGEQYFLNRPEDFLRDHYPAIKRWSLLDKLPVYSDWLQPFILSGQFAPSR